LFWGITMLVTVSFTVLAQAAARQSPDVVALLREGEREAALNAMSSSFAAVGGPAMGSVFLGFIALIGLNATLGLFDSFSRGQADMTYNFRSEERRVGKEGRARVAGREYKERRVQRNYRELDST